jgi:dihydrofolate synthase/folylpolyglutamate synthase
MISSTPFGSSAEVYHWIEQFINLERDPSARNYRLERMGALAEIAGRPETCAPAIHVAGSKGKGTVTGMIASILEAAGKKPSCYASPHISDFRERLGYGKTFFEEGVYAKAGTELRAAAEGSLETLSSKNDEPTCVELMTLWYFLCTRRAGCTSMAVETGMGGRLDATNILDPLVSVITVIELEHTEYLGNTIAAIAGEKAGIIKKGRPVVLSEQKAEALEVFAKKAAKRGSPLLYFPEITAVNDIEINRRGTAFTLEIKSPETPAENLLFKNLHIQLPGRVTAMNAGLAVLAAKTAFPEIREKAIRQGLESFTLPARFERVWDDPVFIIDGAHTSRSAEECVKTFTSLYGEGGVLLFGCAAGKDATSMAGFLAPCFSHIIITAPGTFKKSNPKELYDLFVRKAAESKNRPEIFLVPDTNEAISKAVFYGKKNGLPILGVGSFYLAGEIRNQLRNSQPRT